MIRSIISSAAATIPAIASVGKLELSKGLGVAHGFPEDLEVVVCPSSVSDLKTFYNAQ